MNTFDTDILTPTKEPKLRQTASPEPVLETQPLMDYINNPSKQLQLSKDRIIFFGSGEFPVRTFEEIAELHDRYEIVGLVTTKKSSRLFKKDSPIGNTTLASIAYEKNIPLICWDEHSEDDVYEFCRMLSPDIFCVISFKKLPERFLSLPTKVAFNIHASLLPLLKGSAPINHALLNGFKKTGLTAFILNDKIDSGDILSTMIVDIADDEDFGSLYWRMSNMCLEFTENVLWHLTSEDCNSYISNAIPQASPLPKHPFFKAPKITSDYLEFWEYSGIDNVLNRLRSVSPTDGLHLSLTIVDKNTRNEVKYFEAKILKAHKSPMTTKFDYEFTDGKTYMYCIVHGPFDLYNLLVIDRIQVAGKKAMDIEEFLRGFQVWVNDDKYEIIYNDFYIKCEK